MNRVTAPSGRTYGLIIAIQYAYFMALDIERCRVAQTTAAESGSHEGFAMTVQQAVADSGSVACTTGASTESAPRRSSSGRVASIDALRGFDMFWIIGGGTVFGALADVWPNPVTLGLRHQLEHAHWEGFHFEDMIYPLFLLLTGTVLSFSLRRP